MGHQFARYAESKLWEEVSGAQVVERIGCHIMRRIGGGDAEEVSLVR